MKVTVIGRAIVAPVPVDKELNWRRRLVTPMKWRVIESFAIQIGSGAHCHYIEVVAGLVTDFASVPRLLKPLIPDQYLYSTAAIVHDQLYRDGTVGKRIADAILAGLLQDVDGASNFWAEVFFLAVHCFGAAAWRSHRTYKPSRQ